MSEIILISVLVFVVVSVIRYILNKVGVSTEETNNHNTIQEVERLIEEVRSGNKTVEDLIYPNLKDSIGITVPKGDVPVCSFPVERYELRSTGRYSYSGPRIRIPIIKGVSWSFGGGTVSREKSWQKTGTGNLIVTTNRVIFDGETKNTTLKHNQIAKMNLSPTFMEIEKHQGNSLFFQCSPTARDLALLQLLSSSGGQFLKEETN